MWTSALVSSAPTAPDAAAALDARMSIPGHARALPQALHGVAFTTCRGDRNDRQVTARGAFRQEVGEGAQGQAQRAQGEGTVRGADAAADAPEEAGRLRAGPAPPRPHAGPGGAGSAHPTRAGTGRPV